MEALSDRLLKEVEAAQILGVSTYWLQRQRWLRTGPAYVRVGGKAGRAIRYRLEDLKSWIAANRQGGRS